MRATFVASLAVLFAACGSTGAAGGLTSPGSSTQAVAATVAPSATVTSPPSVATGALSPSVSATPPAPSASTSTSTPAPAASKATAAPSETLRVAPEPAIAHFVDDPIAFSYPGAWHSRTGTAVPSGNVTIIFVGPQVLPSDCVDLSNGGACYGWPVMTLAHGGIVVAWRRNGMPGSRPPTGGDPITVSGRPARISRGPADAGCAAIGGDESIDVVVVPTPPGSPWIGIDACLSGPDHRVRESEFAAILANATIG
jgi:hypothetical protein